MKNFYNIFFQNTIKTILNFNEIELNNLAKSVGRIFFVGVGGSAGNATHAVNDFRKLCDIECYSITDNTSELTARINDEGWDSSFSEWLKVSNLSSKDAVFVLSVGGGNLKQKVSVNIVNAVKFAKQKKAKIFGIVSRDGGYTKQVGDNVVVIPVKEKKLVTPISEALQAVIWHYLVSTSYLKKYKTKW
jgi:D-sedoheptulose 7-phosphate isomerase